MSAIDFSDVVIERVDETRVARRKRVDIPVSPQSIGSPAYWPNNVVQIGASVIQSDLTQWWTIVASSYGAPSRLIEYLGDEYRVLRPIPYEIEALEDGSFEARFEAGNVAIVGDNEHDAYQALIAEILDTFDTLQAEEHLSGDSLAQLMVLRTYIGQA